MRSASNPPHRTSFNPETPVETRPGSAVAVDVLSRLRAMGFPEQVKTDEKEAAKKEAKVESDKTKKTIKTMQSKVEKSTLGDLGALAEITEKLKKEESGE